MRRILMIFAMVAAFAMIAPAAASAWTTMGSCHLHTTLFHGGSAGNQIGQASGWVDSCPDSSWQADETICMQVKTQSGSWVDMHSPETCFLTGWINTPTQTFYSTCGGCGSGGYVDLTPGHTYRGANHASDRSNGKQFWNSYYTTAYTAS